MKVGTDGVLLGAWVENNGEKRILDVGTGTGLVALMLAQRFPRAMIKGIDIEKDAVEEAKENVELSPWQDRLAAEQVSLQNYANRGEHFDLVVSNPPYFTNGTQSPSITRHRARHSETLSYTDLAQCSERVLNPGGTLAVILPAPSRDTFVEQAKRCDLYLWRILNFRPKPSKEIERVLLQFGRTQESIRKENLCQYDEAGKWSSAYQALTKEYYLNL